MPNPDHGTRTPNKRGKRQTMTTQELQDTLEGIVDKTTLRRVLFALAEICSAKAIHIQENWQDEQTSKPWAIAGTQIERAASRIEGI